MLQITDISKSYTTGSFTQKALDDVSISFRDNEFVAILGPSGSGKTTLLNILGGLDAYDSGDLIIEGISTKEYKDRDWDAYRNNRIGFVFQAYNLIPHQTVLANVELALTLSGVSKAERRKRAVEALERVGLKDHVGKKPSQLSGGQMQRVAIARALINDPEILLADEPTGALDSKTSVQIMDLLTEIARDRLVVMVTHNPELAEQYATRIVNLADGTIRSDSMPYHPTESEIAAAHGKKAVKTSMSFLTALSLSFNNLMTKKGRTIMTAFAGSIGIIGIAAILSLANGVNDYIADVEEQTLSEYPLTIAKTGMDLSAMLGAGSGSDDEGSSSPVSLTGSSASPSAAATGSADEDASSFDGGDVKELGALNRMFSSVNTNDLASLKTFLDGNGGNVNEYVNLIEYDYGIKPLVFSSDTESGARQVNPDTTMTKLAGYDPSSPGASMGGLLSSSMTSYDAFAQLPSNPNLYEKNYNVLAGRWPSSYDELVLVVNSNEQVSDLLLYSMGLKDPEKLDQMAEAFGRGENVDTDQASGGFSFAELMSPTFKAVDRTKLYERNDDYGTWVDKSDDADYMKSLVENSDDLRIVGIVQADPDANGTALPPSRLYYTPALRDRLVDEAAQSDIVKQQMAEPDTNVFTGKGFDDETADGKGDFDMSSLFTIDQQALSQAFSFDPSALSNLSFNNAALSGFDMASAPSSDLSLDLSGIDWSGMELSGADLSNIDLSSVDLSDLASSFPQLGEALSQLDYASILKAANGALGASASNDIAQTASRIMQGFPAYLSAHPSATIGDYLAEPSVQTQINQVVSTVANNEAVQKAVSDEMQRQLSAKLSAQDIDAVSKAVQQRIASAISSQIGAQLAGSMSQSLSAGLQKALQGYISQMMTALSSQVSSAVGSYMGQLSSSLSSAMNVSPETFAKAFQFNMDQDELTRLLTSMVTAKKTSYEDNLKTLGYADYARPEQISLYPKDFNSKEKVVEILDAYNADAKAAGDDDRVVTYTDLVGTLMSSVTTIIDMISYVLIAFVSISLVVSSIMIGVITYISVLERRKEIGILRSIGASKRNVSEIFNAETVIEGLIAGIMGVGVTALACIPVNAVVNSLFNVAQVAILPWQAAVVLVAISVLLTFIAGLIPASRASKADPVEALRSE